MNNSYIIPAWYPTQNYSQYDFTQGESIGGAFYPSPSIYFSTVANNSGNNPSGLYSFQVSGYSRVGGQATMTFAPTGSPPSFAPGALVAISGLYDQTFSFTGMVIKGGANYIVYTNPGQDISYQSNTGIINCPNPAWTTGFFWTPSYNTALEIKQNTLVASFEPTYSARSPAGLNSNTASWAMEFSSRSDTEAAGIMCFTQNLGGVYSCPLLIPPSKLYNNPYLKYVLTNPKSVQTSYGINNVTLTATQVFEA